MKRDSITEKKIKQAAKEIFLEKWLSWSRTREITEKAWVNLALLNYYFGSKEDLFYSVMSDVLQEFHYKIFFILNDRTTSFEEKLRILCDSYFDSLISDSKLFPFIIEIVKKNLDKARNHIKSWNSSISNTYFAEQYLDKTKKSMDDFRMFFINLLWLIAFPFVWSPLFSALFDYTQEEYIELLLRRKESLYKILPYLY